MNSKHAKACECAGSNSENYTVKKLSHYFFLLPEGDPDLAVLLHFLEAITFTRAVIFVRDAVRVEHLAAFIVEHGHPSVVEVHELMPDHVRTEIFQQFKEDNPPFRILVTSCSSHVLECTDVNFAIHFDQAESSALYYHRVCSTQCKLGIVFTIVRNYTYVRVLLRIQKDYGVKVFNVSLNYRGDASAEPGERKIYIKMRYFDFLLRILVIGRGLYMSIIEYLFLN